MTSTNAITTPRHMRAPNRVCAGHTAPHRAAPRLTQQPRHLACGDRTTFVAPRGESFCLRPRYYMDAAQPAIGGKSRAALWLWARSSLRSLPPGLAQVGARSRRGSSAVRAVGDAEMAQFSAQHEVKEARIEKYILFRNRRSPSPSRAPTLVRNLPPTRAGELRDGSSGGVGG